MEKKILTVEQFCAISGLRKQTVYNTLNTNPAQLPPRRRILNSKGIYFLSSDVEEWLDNLPKHYGTKTNVPDESKKSPPKNPVGRPRKSVQIARQRAIPLVEQDA
jgi:predicted DNA-binding transcriptional regulator AlpA